MLKPLVAHLWRAELEQYFANMNGKRAFEYEDLCGLLLRGGSVGNVTLPERRLVPTTNQEHTSSLIRGIKKEGQMVVVAYKSYWVLDFATSLYHWFNAKVGESTPTVNSGAFVTLLLELDMATKEDLDPPEEIELSNKKKTTKKKLVMKLSEDEKITLTVMRNTPARTFVFKDNTGLNNEDLEYSDELKELFEKHITVEFLDVSNWDPRDITTRKNT